MERFCAEEGVPFEICGKVIVAVTAEELPRLEAIYERGRANGVTCELIGRERLAELEPHAAGRQAIHVPETGIVDYAAVCERLRQRVTEAGGEVRLNVRATALRSQGREVCVTTGDGDFVGRQAVNCAGLHSDRVARWAGASLNAQIVPFRGEYYELKPHARGLVRNLIYPTPDPAFPFLGVHFTRMTGGGVECGPNAVLAFAREGYRKLAVNPRDLWETLRYRGFWRLAAAHWRTGAGEMWRSASKGAFVRALRRLVPDLSRADLETAPAGVRAQAVAADGSMVDDFLFVASGRVVNVVNAPSPAATSALNVGNLIVDQLTALERS
jgi:L-2-hydroxyglutarate oxidase